MSYLSNVEIVKKRINRVKCTDKLEQEIKAELIDYYCVQNVARTNTLLVSTIVDFPFGLAIKSRAKLAKAKTALIKDCVSLEMHTFAPELNTLHFKNNSSFRCGWNIGQNYEYTIDNSIDLMLQQVKIENISIYTK